MEEDGDVSCFLKNGRSVIRAAPLTGAGPELNCGLDFLLTKTPVDHRERILPRVLRAELRFSASLLPSRQRLYQLLNICQKDAAAFCLPTSSPHSKPSSRYQEYFFSPRFLYLSHQPSLPALYFPCLPSLHADSTLLLWYLLFSPLCRDVNENVTSLISFPSEPNVLRFLAC